MKIKKYLFVLSLVCLCGLRAFAAETGKITINLSKAEEDSLKNSSRLKAAVFKYQAAGMRQEQQSSYLNPRLSLDAYFRYNTHVPEIDVPFGGLGSIKMGDNSNFSFGPTLSWRAWDGGVLKNNILSVTAAAESSRLEAEAVKRQLLLSCRKKYFQLVLASEQVILLNEALQLARTRYDDIKVNVRVGTKSRRDELASHQDVLLRSQQLSQARADMAAALRELSAISGVDYAESKCIPFSAASAIELPDDMLSTTVYVTLDPVSMLLDRYKVYIDSELWDKHPAIEVFSELARSAEYAAQSAAASEKPAIMLTASSTLNYPDAAKAETFIQNSAGLALSVPLYESALSGKKESEFRKIREADIEMGSQKKTEFAEIWNKVNDQLMSLAEQEIITELAVNESLELARIIYKSYKAGSVTYIEVQNVNYRMLELKIKLARIKVQELVNMAVLASLAEEE